MGKRIVIALGGNALGNTPYEQLALVTETAKPIVDLIAQGNEVIIAHGNGPQVGMINLGMATAAEAKAIKSDMPFPECGAMSQGYIGYHLQNAIGNELAARGACVDVVIGATTAARLACTEQFEDSVRISGGALHVATDDGSVGVRGFVNAITDELLATRAYDYVAVCGPPLMERSVALPAIEHGVTCEVSMERLMACGVGACLGCVVETRDGLKRCCVDGPVFDASEVIW